MLQRLESRFSDSDVAEQLHKARKARNEVAHEFPAGLDYIIEDTDKLKAHYTDLRRAVVDIAEGDRLVSALLSLATNEPLPTGAVYDSYVEKLVAWVCTLSPLEFNVA